MTKGIPPPLLIFVFVVTFGESADHEAKSEASIE